MEIQFIEDEVMNEVVEEKEDFIKSFINTKLKNYITYEELLEYYTTKLQTIKKDIIIKYLSNSLSIVNNDIYIYNEDIQIHHKLNGKMDIDDFLKVYIITFIETSYTKISKQQETLLHKMFNSTISQDTLKLIKTNLRVDEKKFTDPKLGEIHFKNGYIKIETGTFHIRKRTDYMTYCLWRDYKNSSKEKINKVENIIKQIYPNEGDRNCVLECFGEGLTGHSVKSQYNLFLLGIGSSGKSTLMKMCKASFKEMIFEFKEDTFSINNTKSDRVLNMLMHNPYIRIMWVNELKGKIDDSLFKQVCEGQVNTTTLFQEGQNTVKFNALLVNTMNEFPNIKMDSGVERRIKSLEHKSRFSYDKNEVNENNNIYLADTNLMELFTKDEELQNALVGIITKYAHEFLKGNRYALSENFKETKSNIVNTNDIIGEFIKNNITKTENEKDKLSLEELFDFFKATYQTSKITIQQLMGSLKDKGLNYNANARTNNKRGCFICVKSKDDDVEEEEEGYDFGKKGTINILKEENKKLLDEIELLKQQLKTLQNNNKPNEELKTNIKPIQQKQLSSEEEELKELIRLEEQNKQNNVVELKTETEKVEVKKPKKTFTMEELNEKIKIDMKVQEINNKQSNNKVESTNIKDKQTKSLSDIPIDIDDGYATDELELEFEDITKKLKKPKKNK